MTHSVLHTFLFASLNVDSSFYFKSIFYSLKFFQVHETFPIKPETMCNGPTELWVNELWCFHTDENFETNEQSLVTGMKSRGRAKHGGEQWRTSFGA